MYAQGLRCTACGRQYLLEPMYNCGSCSGILEVVYDYEKLRISLAKEWVDSYPAITLALLPVHAKDQNSLALQPTPLIRATRLAKRLGIKQLQFKCEFLNPTGSFKDRPISVAVAKAKEFNLQRLVVASSGNAAAATSAYAARNDLSAIILVPENTPTEKVRQAAFYGALVLKVKGPYSRCFHLARLAAEQLDLFNVTTTFINPYSVEGDKVIAHEILHQTRGIVPDVVCIPVGAGPLLVGMYKGFGEFAKLGLVGGEPRMVGVQATGCRPITDAFLAGRTGVIPVKSPRTVAGGICDGLDGYAQDGTYTLQAICRSGGFSLAVTDDEILNAQRELAQDEGLFVEPSGAVAIAGLKRGLLTGEIKAVENVVVVLTGHGLKDMNSAGVTTNEVVVVDSVDELQAQLARLH